jgi:type III pantothenate kinase
MRIITIDNGNSNPHVGIFVNGELSSVIPLTSYHKKDDDIIVISNVGKEISLKSNIDLKKFRTENEFFNMPINYAETLGDDRLFQSFLLFQNINTRDRILLLDAGTFLTADVITSVGFMGGYIFPGSKTFLKSYTDGHLLPHVKSLTITETLPYSTEEAISMAHEIYWESIIENLIKKISPNRIVLTGGDGQMLEKKIKRINLEFQPEFDPHLLHKSMHLLYLHYSANQK